ncbi:MAG: rhomboid family intramembrane serine protease [Polyangiaceae bacterium]|nr:rhomboid family intramembrane serine protease [Polyangiaceae bacterium]
MAQEPDSADPDFPSWLLSAGKLFGLTPIQTRWKLRGLHRKWRSMRRELAPASRRFEHQICASCGAVQPHENRVCTSCREPLASPTARFLRGVGLAFPSFLSVSSLLGLAMILIYFRMMLFWRGEGLLRWSIEAFVAHGGLFPVLVEGGQWWRVGTANFLHLGVMHIFFNVAGLSQAGPLVEEAFGRARMLFIFAATGVLAMYCSAVVMPGTPTAGASGALMGLIGAAGAWGHRDKSTVGTNVRNQMLKWGVYTMLFGFLVNGNHVAHAAGFASGWVIGSVYDTKTLEATKRSTVSLLLGLVGGVACAAFILLCLAPPQISWDTAESIRGRPAGTPAPHDSWGR